MEKKEVSAPPKEEEKKTEGEKIPKIGEPKESSVFPGLSGVNQHVAILSFLHYRDLIKVVKTSRQAFHFIMDEETRRRVLNWKPERDEETRVNNYILSLIQAIDVKE